MSGLILIVEDEQLVRWALKEQLQERQYNVLEAASGQEARDLLEREVPDCILLDIRLPDADGLHLIGEFQKTVRDVPVIIMTGHGNVETAIEAMRLGATDYIDKPFHIDAVELKIERALNLTQLAREVRHWRQRNGAVAGFNHIIAGSPAMRTLLDLADKAAQSPSTTILITGESGTGKDVLARSIHANSQRASKAFMNITCSALQDQLLESELFGHERGAFTGARECKHGLFELSNGGTVFLDEIGETSPAFQAKLLRVLEEKRFKRVGGTEDISVDVRVIAATNRHLETEVREGRFREDLFFRLDILSLHLPPLRERRDDILPLAEHFLVQLSGELGRPVATLHPDIRDWLLQQDWPGNVRDLRNAVERALILSPPGAIEIEHFRPSRLGAQRSPSPTIPEEGLHFENDVERAYLLQALIQSGGHHSRAAKLLGMNRDQIRYRIKKFDIQDHEWGGTAQ